MCSGQQQRRVVNRDPLPYDGLAQVLHSGTGEQRTALRTNLLAHLQSRHSVQVSGDKKLNCAISTDVDRISVQEVDKVDES